MKGDGCALVLQEVPLGQTGFVNELIISGDTRRRLMDLGFLPGTKIVPLFRGPSGDPTAYRVLGAVIALRAELASRIQVERR